MSEWGVLIGLNCSFQLVYGMNSIVITSKWCTTTSCAHLVAFGASRMGGIATHLLAICESFVPIDLKMQSLRWGLWKDESEVEHVSGRCRIWS